MTQWKPDKNQSYKLVMEGAGAKVFLAFFRQFTDTVDATHVVYPKVKAKNNHLVYEYFQAFKELGYLEESKRKKPYDKRVKGSYKGKPKFKTITPRTEYPCYRGNLLPFYQYCYDEKNILFSEFEMKLLEKIFDLDYVRTKVCEKTNVIEGMKDVLCQALGIRMKMMVNKFNMYQISNNIAVGLKQNFDIITKLWGSTEKGISMLLKFIDNTIEELKQGKIVATVVDIKTDKSTDFNPEEITKNSDKIKFYLFAIHLPQFLCYKILEFIPDELSKVINDQLFKQFTDETEFDISFQNKMKRSLKTKKKKIQL